jgi:signal transduction histidine kinase
MIRSLTKEAPPPPAPPPLRPTSKLREENERLKQQLLHAHKLANLGTMVGMLAHECNNLLTPIVTYGRFALDSHDPALLRKGLEITLRQSAVLMKMSDRMLGLMAQQAPAYQAVELRKVLEEAVESLCRDLAKDGITLHNQIPAGWQVLGDPDALQQLFFNLLLNSRRALLNRKGTITIAATLLDGGRVRIRFRDTGCGIHTERLAQVFEAFNTSKSSDDDQPRKAAGLGLAICKLIAEDHQGAIAVESELNLGTTFLIDLPTAASQHAVLPHEKTKKPKKPTTARQS